MLDPASVEAADARPGGGALRARPQAYSPPTRILSEGTRNILRAMETHGVRRFVCETSLGIGDSAGRMGLVLHALHHPGDPALLLLGQDAAGADDRGEPAEWVIVRPGALTNGARRGDRGTGAASAASSWTVRISRADVAAFMLDQLESDAYLRAAPGVCW